MAIDAELQNAGGVTKATLAALEQIHKAITAAFANPDGSPSGSAVYMHLPMGYPIDPKMYAHPWTPAGGSSDASVSNTGAFAQPAPAPAADATGVTPAAALAAQAAAAATVNQQSQQAAYFTARLVDNMLMVTDKGVARAWPEHRVSLQYWTALQGMQAEPVSPPTPEVQARIDAARKLLYTFDDAGNMTGYTKKYDFYRANYKKWQDAVAAFADGYAAASADPIAGGAWPVKGGKLQTDVDNAKNDLVAMGKDEIEQALNTLHTVGGSAAAALIAQAKNLYDSYNVNLAGAIAVKLPWSYINPLSWWDHTNNDFGVIRVKATTQEFAASGAAGSDSFSSSYYHNTSESTGGSAGVNIGFFSFGANASHSESTADWGSNSRSSSWSNYKDESSSATIAFEYFLATIERPWLVGDILHMDGWYYVDHEKGSISDGTVEGQLDNDAKILPMIPKAFVVIRNVSITADHWGDAGSAFQNAQSSSTGHTDSESTSFGGSVGYFGIGGSASHSSSDASGAFSSQGSTNSGWSFESNAQGGTLKLLGSQIIGWIGEVQPLSPKVDAPKGDAPKGDAPAGELVGAGASATGASGTAGTGATTGNGSTPQP
jgi:hypothetical protein